MLQGLYAASSGMEAQQNQFNAISNDLANLNTPGYQATEVGFQDLLYSGAGSASGSSLATGAGASSAIVGRSQAQGALDTTGNPLDVAISARATSRSAVRRQHRPDPQRHAADRRAGPDHRRAGQPARPRSSSPGRHAGRRDDRCQRQHDRQGPEAGQACDRHRARPDQLQADGDSLFSVTAGSGAARPATGATVQQGALEASNVNVSQVMSTMIASERSYQMASQAVQYQSQMLEIAATLKK